MSAPVRNVLLVGGTSEIGLSILERLATQRPTRAHLLGRDRARLEAAAAQLERAGCLAGAIHESDLDDTAGHRQVLEEAFAESGGFELIVLAVGVLGAQAGLDADPEDALEVMRVNFLIAGSLLLRCLSKMRPQDHGTAIVLSTVAAERPRASNAIYGAAKAGLDALAQGLADQAAPSGVRVLVIRPGFVKTRMTEGLPPAPFATNAESVAQATVNALDGNAHTIWVPSRLRPVFALLRHLPRPLYRRLPL